MFVCQSERQRENEIRESGGEVWLYAMYYHVYVCVCLMGMGFGYKGGLRKRHNT